MFTLPATPPPPDTASSRIAIIDIGSNSIRLVVYDQQKRAPVSIYNEKVMCGLGRGLAETGLLNEEGVELAKAALARFLAMGRIMHISELYIMATAAVRDAQDGAEFVRYLEDKHDITIDVISGEHEARLGAYAVCSSMHKPCGMMGDMGGGSLECVFIEQGQTKGHATLKLGSLRLVDETGGDREKMRRLIEKRFTRLELPTKEKIPQFYAIGGSFRALAKMYMTATKYPLSILHEFTVDAKSFLPFVREIAAMPDDKLAKYPGMAIKRLPQIPGAALLMEKIITTTGCKKIVFSASGIREGYVYEKLSDKLREEDGLISACTEFASRQGRTIAYGGDLYLWMAPLIQGESEESSRLRLAFCMLSEIALHIHPEYRAEWAYNRIIFSALTSLSHRERVILALALYHRYQYKLPKKLFAELKLIREADRRWAHMVGAAANLAYHLSGSIAGNLHKMSLDISSLPIRLLFAEDVTDIMGEAVARRLNGLNEAYKAYHQR